jgi:hypothetical protein
MNQWPAELDALTAAAQHHKLLFENGSVRVLETIIHPGDRTNIHTHEDPASLYFISCSDFIRYDAAGNAEIDSRTLDKVPTPGSVSWSGPLAPHSLHNIGEKDIHVISVEIKQ